MSSVSREADAGARSQQPLQEAGQDPARQSQAESPGESDLRDGAEDEADRDLREQVRAAEGAGDRNEQNGRCDDEARSEEHTSELQSLMRTSYAVFCLQQKKKRNTSQT